MPLSEHDEQVIDTYAKALAKAMTELWPPISEAKRERLAVLLSAPAPGSEPGAAPGGDGNGT